MKFKFFYSLLFLASFVFSQANAQQTAKVSPKGTGFLQYLPEGYNSNTNKWPIVIALHGIKEKGTTSTVTSDIIASVAKVANVGLPKYVKYGAQYPFILISPQLKSNMGRWTGDYVMEVLNYVKTYLRVDPNRIYLTGLSLGGGGVWSVATAYPEVWASILPLCSGYNVASAACKLSAVDLPVWGFHGDADKTVNYSVTVNMINAINNCSPTPSPKAKLTILPGMAHVIWDKVYKQTDALTWMLSFKKGSSTGSSEPVPTTNDAPVASAGSDKTVTLPTNSVSITGSASDDDGTVSSYTWTKKSGGSASLSGATSKTLAVSNLAAGTYVFTLTAKDNDGATGSDDVTVTVKSTTNSAPVANAGSNVQVLLPTSTATLHGSATDANGNISSYSWTKVSGGSASLSGNTTATLSLSGLQSGTYTFRLTVKDSNGASDTDDVLVIVDAPPTVNAGGDKTVSLPLASLNLTATASDPDGNITNYNWYKVSGPSLKLTNATSKTVTLSGLVAGTYVVKAVVKDNKGITATDQIKIVVKGSVASIQTSSGTTLLASL